MKILLSLLLATSLNAATVTFTWTNFDGSISTNDLVVTMVNPPINDGTFTIKGLPRRYPTTNGFLSATILSGNYSVVPYGVNIQPVLFAVPNDSQTYDYWQLRISGGNTYNYSPGVQQIVAGNNVTVSPSNGKGIVTINSSGTGSGQSVSATSPVTATTNGNLTTVGLAFTPQIASSTLSNYSTVGTNYWYPTNNPQGFIPSNAVPLILGYVTNVVTTNTSSGVTNIINGVIAGAPIGNLSNVKITSPANGNILTYQNGNWTNSQNSASVTSVALSAPAEFSVSGSPVTSSGTLAISKANQSANLVYAGPSSGGAAAPAFRALVAADIPAASSTVYASNILSGGQISPSVVAPTAAVPNGWFAEISNGTNIWSNDGSRLTNIQAAAANVIVGSFPASSFGVGSASASKFLRGDQLWSATLSGPLTLSGGGNFTNNGNVSLDNGAILSDGSGDIVALKWIGQHYGNGFGLTNVSSTNLIDVLADARIPSTIPRLSIFNDWTGANQFDHLNTQVNGLLDVGASSIFQGTIGIGSSASVGSSNKFQIQNAQGRYVFEVQTNGTAWYGTNHQLFINFNGGIESYLGTNFFGGTIVNSNTFTGNKVVSYEFDGSGSGLTNIIFAGISNITNAAASQKFLAGSSANSAQWANISGSSPVTIQQPFADSYTWGLNPGQFDNFAGGGGSLTNLNANSITGILKLVNFPVLGAVYPTAITNNDTRQPVLNGANFTALNASSLASGTVPTAREGSGSATANTLLHGNQAWSAVVEADQSLSDVTTANATTSAHGYLKKLDNTATHYMDGTGNWSTPAGTTGTDSTAWHQDGDSVANPGSHTYVVGPTNGLTVERRMNAGAGAGATIERIETGADRVNMYSGFTNGAISATEFFCTVYGGQHNVINTAGVTADQIFAGQFNFIDSGGGGNYGATIIGGASNHVAGTGSYAMGVGARAINDHSFVWCGLDSRIVTTSGSAGDNGKMLLAFSNAGVEFTNGNDASINGDFKLFGQSGFSTNCAEPNAGTFGWTNGTGGFSLVWNGTNPPSAGKALKVINGSLGGSNAVVFGTQVLPQAFQIKTNGDVRIEGNVTVLGTVTTSGFSPGAGALTYASLAVPYATNIANHFADQGNSTTSDTTLYSDSIPASTLSSNGQKIRAKYGLNTVAHATATREIKVFFGGTSILDTTALATPTTADNVDIEVLIIRDSSTSIRYDCRASMAGGLATNFVSVGKLTGLTLSSANTIELHGQAGASGAASNDIVATLGTVNFEP